MISIVQLSPRLSRYIVVRDQKKESVTGNAGKQKGLKRRAIRAPAFEFAAPHLPHILLTIFCSKKKKNRERERERAKKKKREEGSLSR